MKLPISKIVNISIVPLDISNMIYHYEIVLQYGNYFTIPWLRFTDEASAIEAKETLIGWGIPDGVTPEITKLDQPTKEQIDVFPKNHTIRRTSTIAFADHKD